MTPLDFARNLAASQDEKDQALGVAILTRGVTDDDPATLRQGWPLNVTTVRRAAIYLGIENPSDALVDRALVLAPTVSDAMLNRS